MAYARKAPVKTDQGKCCGDFAEHVWNSFSKLSAETERVDLYIDSIAKEN